MRKRKIKRQKPMFRKRSASRTALHVILILILLLGIAFLGYSVGKPILDFLGQHEERESESTDPQVETVITTTSPTITVTKETETEPEPEPEPEPETGKMILAIGFPAVGSYDDWLDSMIIYAKENDYYGVSVELLGVGGRVYFATSNERAAMASAIADGGIADLSSAAQRILDAGLVPYARISELSDNLAAWDKSICYLFENSTSTWLDNSISSGGKPWISAFSTTAREYIGSLAKEISDAGFASIIAGEVEFPPFRNSDLNYVGASVKAADRYLGLCDFSNYVREAIGGAKGYAVEVDAVDIISGYAEILSDISALHSTEIYVKYDSADFSDRVSRADGSEVSYSGLSEQAKATVVFRSIRESLGSDAVIIPAVRDVSIVSVLEDLGFDSQRILVY